MPILTLTTDWSNRDHYVAAFKGELLSRIPGIIPVDVSHTVAKFNIMEASYLLKNCYSYFPEGTIHFIGLTGSEEAKSDTPFILVKSEGHYFIGHDSGIFTLLFGENEKEIIRLPLNKNQSRKNINSSLITTIAEIFEDKITSVFSREVQLFESYFARPTFNSDSIGGSIISIDSFGNAIVNITSTLFNKIQNSRAFHIDFRKAQISISRICTTYDDVEPGDLAVLFNQDGYLEIAINRDSAESMLGLRLNDQVRVEFV